MEDLRAEFDWLAGDEANIVYSAGGEVAWWTFAGGRANAALADELGRRLDLRVGSDNFVINFAPRQPLDAIRQEIGRLSAAEPQSFEAPVSEAARDGLKFAECLPGELADRVVQERLAETAALAGTLADPTRAVVADYV